MKRTTHFEDYINVLNNRFNYKVSDDPKIRQLELEAVTWNMSKVVENDITMFLEIQTLYQFIKEGMLIYKICEEFGKDLHTVDLDVPVKYIKHNDHTICIEFPDWFMPQHSDGTFARCCYIRQESAAIDTRNLKQTHGLRLQFPDYDADMNLIESVSFINIKLEGYETITKAISDLPVKEFSLSHEAIQFAVKSYLYILSGQPDLRKIKASEKPKTSKPKKLNRWEKESRGEKFDYFQVGYDYKKARRYNADSCDVRGHYRWQPYGQQNSNIKLIWINAHTRNYNNMLKTS